AISTVDVGPDELILSSIGAGLSPITDGEAAEIASGPQTGGIINQTLATGLVAIDDTHSAGSFSPSESAGSSISGTISQALGAIPSAMSALQGALGGAQCAPTSLRGADWPGWLPRERSSPGPRR